MMNSRLKQVVFYTFFGMASLGLTGCPATAKKETKAPETPVTQEPQKETKAPATSGVTIGSEWTALNTLKDGYFDFDKADLRGDTRSALKANADVLKKLPKSVQMMVEGHCDERGTIEYNVALGQKRANAAKDYYIHTGVGRDRLKTISYGKEHPVCGESTEGCWARNRRAATKVRSDQSVTVPAGM